ncbi:hypothetical protein D8674_033662 [Pyrus ussuriensis x Pyrus communis]|uniref:Uncharacterized protein n=1 Tax=Pyrus ussuriensis x Pyrus communis TaxID=2448454 RepID=A0A5N5HPW8_9ROSA|nr:hypothetical protein D8674_033662 [Pyrus ussuriensis x Pyrus communis]
MAKSIRSSISSCSSRHLQASVLRPSYLSANDRDRCRLLGNRRFLQPLIMKVESGSRKKMDVVVNSVEPGSPLPSDPSGTDWKLWLVGMLFTVVIPFWKNKWWPLLKFKERFSTALDTVEDVAEMVEKVAGEVEKVEEVEKEVDYIIEQANQKIKEENDTENQTAKIKDASEIKTKIAEIKETNVVKKETTKS